jgi:predicted dehydrogenase
MITIFSDCILEGGEPPAGLADGRHNVRICDAIYKASKEGVVVKLGE